jgi:DNA processing protein
LSAPNYQDLVPWVALSRVKGLGCVGFKRLVAHFPNPTAVFRASAGELMAVSGLERDAIEALLHFSEWAPAEAESRRAWHAGVSLIPFTDPRYPARLRLIPDPPPLLYVRGELLPHEERAVAIVGSRSASEYGLKVARSLSRGLAVLGFTVVSGMARGIDGAAHQSALDAGARSIAVLGCGVDRVYPPEHISLYRSISERGAVISEFSMGARPASYNFPARNRLISGLCLGVVVVEATEKSGSLITAALALEQNREVFAVPGEVGSSRSRGAHRLIRQGAKLVESVDDIIEEIAPQLAGQETLGHRVEGSLPQQWSAATRKIYGMLQERILHIDEVIESSGLSSAQVAQILLDLELQGFLRQLPGNRYLAEQ